MNPFTIGHAACCLIAALLLSPRLTSPGQFVGAGHLSRAADLASLLFVVAFVVTFFRRRVGAAVAFAGCLLWAPSVFYLAARTPSVPHVLSVLVLLVTIPVSLANARSNTIAPTVGESTYLNAFTISQGACCLLASLLLSPLLDEPGEFVGGRVTGPLFHMADLAWLLFMVAFVAMFFRRRVGATIALGGCLLWAPLVFYLAARAPSAPQALNVLALLATIYASVANARTKDLVGPIGSNGSGPDRQ
jgi:hypothetical protein